MRRLLFLFLDGVGLGPASASNPLADVDGTALRELAGGQPWTDALQPHTSAHRHVAAIDATLGVDGLPQSGTGQATLFTGTNCAALVGRHFGPFPHSATHDVLASESLFHKVGALDLPVEAPAAFANAYPPRFFEWANGRGRWTVTTRAYRGAGLAVRGEAEVRAGRALTADMTGRAWRDQLGIDVPLLDEAEAGRRFVAIGRHHAVTAYEYYRTDKAGHGRLDVGPEAIVRGVDRFVGGVLKAMDPDVETLVVTSDHGNLEDVSRKTHTRNPVPLLVYGWAAAHFQDATSLTDVTPALVRAARKQA